MVGHGQALPKATTKSAKEARKAFFCELCNKGYARQNEYDAHEGSYDHQHRKRLKDLRSMTRDPNAAAKARAAEQEAAGMKPMDLSAAAPKKKPVFKSTLQPHNAGVVPALTSTATAGVTDDDDPSGMVRNGWAADAYKPTFVTGSLRKTLLTGGNWTMPRTKATPCRGALAPSPTPTPSDHVPELPEEILQLILEQLSPSLRPVPFQYCDDGDAVYRSTLANVCLAAKRFLRLARPLLYATLPLGKPRSVVAMGETFATAPHLCELVRTLQVDHWDCDPRFGMERVVERKVDESVWPRLEQAVAGLEPSVNPVTSQPLREALREGRQDAYIALVLMTCRNVEKVQLTIPCGFEISWVSAVLRRAGQMQGSEQSQTSTSRPPYLGHLNSLYIEHWDTENTCDLSDVITAMRLNTLTEFSGFAIDVTGDVDNDGRPLPTTSPSGEPLSLRTIELREAVVDADGLQDVVSRCPQLARLTIEWGGVLQGDATVDFIRIAADLVRYVHGLEHLTLDFSAENRVGDGHHDVIPPLGSLKGLTALKSLRLAAFAIWGSDEYPPAEPARVETQSLASLLPDGLKSLCLTFVDDYDDFLAHKEGLIRDALARIETLRLVTVEGEVGVPRDDETSSSTPWGQLSGPVLTAYSGSLRKSEDGSVIKEMHMPEGYVGAI